MATEKTTEYPQSWRTPLPFLRFTAENSPKERPSRGVVTEKLRSETLKEAAVRVGKAIYPADVGKATEAAALIAEHVFIPDKYCFNNAGSQQGLLSEWFFLPIADDFTGELLNMRATFARILEIRKNGGIAGIDLSAIKPIDSQGYVRTVDKNDFLPRILDGLFGLDFFLAFLDGCLPVSDAVKLHNHYDLNTIFLRVDHPDIEEFIDWSSRVDINNPHWHGLRTCVVITDDFMTHEEFDLRNPQTKQPTGKKLKSAVILERIVQKICSGKMHNIIFAGNINAVNAVPNLDDRCIVNPCITGDTPVYTAQGIFTAEKLCESGTTRIQLPIRTIPIGSSHLESKFAISEAETASGVFRTGMRDTTVRVSTEEGFEINVTPDHKLLTGERRWVAAEKLHSGQTLLLLDHPAARHTSDTHEQSIDECMSYRNGFFLGYAFVKSSIFTISEPHTPRMNDIRLMFSYNPSERYLIEEFEQWLYDCMPYRRVDKQVADPNTVYFYGDAIHHWLLDQNSIRINRSDVIRLPNTILTADSITMSGFIYGLIMASTGNRILCPISTDVANISGHCPFNAPSFCFDVCTDKKSVQDLQHLLLFNGIMSSLRWSDESSHDLCCATLYCDFRALMNLYLTNLGCDRRIIRVFPVIQFDNKSALVPSSQRTDSMDTTSDRGVAAIRDLQEWKFEAHVKSVTTYRHPGPIPVYDVTVAGIHAFTAAGIVTHNCGGQPLGPYETCCYGNINLAHEKFVAAWRNRDFDYIASVVERCVRFLDAEIDANKYIPTLPIFERRTKMTRKIGLGVTGLPDFLIHMGLSYGSDAAVQITNDLMKVIAYNALKSSLTLAKELGPFPLFSESRYADKAIMQKKLLSMCSTEESQYPSDSEWAHLISDILKYGLRNASICTIGPISTDESDILKTVEGIGCEPIESLSYLDRKSHLRVVRPLFLQMLHIEAEKNGMPEEYVQRIIQHVREKGTITHPPDSVIPIALTGSYLGKLFGCMENDISLEQRLQMHLAVQQWTDGDASMEYKWRIPRSGLQTVIEEIRTFIYSAWNLDMCSINPHILNLP